MEQLKDADHEFRKEAITAIGHIARKHKKLVPVLLETLRTDPNHEVGQATVNALVEIDFDLLPPLLDLAKKKNKDLPELARQRAIGAIGSLKSDVTPSIPVLVQVLKESPPRETRDAAINALFEIGPQAKDAIPVLFDLLGKSLRDTDKEKYDFVDLNQRLISALYSLDHATLKVVNNHLRLESIQTNIRRMYVSGSAQQWRDAFESLKKVYLTEK